MASLVAQKAFVGSTFSKAALSKKQNVVRSSRQRMTVEARAAKTKAAMVCVDCGYIYDGPEAFDDAPNSYRCPVCAAPKRRFKEFRGSVPRGNDPKSMISRRDKLRAQLEDAGETVDEDNTLLYSVGATSILLLGALYYFATTR
mmetsp:Transcript_13817/g.29817  ORF Transcript_13817/g.29817 Transcript_13817/m.29817 type:complete len:144 (+) Transcript_13817:103-534(+)|eukprot:CAMPEP_0202907474 /NCGR_PEP_ID=MMETSP1392-20130828/42676_1 /ASSEMBLY_ACC=CAM_ASM_000868 /TAXON_ID=225041 /ORGANISM="Chlamydomonas chlamydogama, Strain SAG 11-48b" /LENGTH=143 /DNA_ID=CAMNT_0049596383 /DNA_START=27 /DNA_END=458 /DNA_ORIENTATION=-